MNQKVAIFYTSDSYTNVELPCADYYVPLIYIKGALDNILEFSFWLNFIYQVKNDCLFTNTKRNIEKFIINSIQNQFLLSMH